MTLYDDHQIPEEEIVALLQKWDVPKKTLASNHEFVAKLQARRQLASPPQRTTPQWGVTQWLAAAVLALAVIPAGRALLHETDPIEPQIYQASAANDEALQEMAYDPLDPSDLDWAQYEEAAALDSSPVSDDTSLFMQPGQDSSHTGITTPGHTPPQLS